MTTHSPLLEHDHQAAAELLRAMAHPMRLAILNRLLESDISVSGLESELGLRQPSLSQQLGQLREAGLVKTRRDARSVTYSIADPRMARLLDALHRYLHPSGESQITKAAPPAQIRQPIAASNAECGVFAVAGWKLPKTTVGKTRNG